MQEHYVAVLAHAADEDAANMVSSPPGLLAGLITPGGRDVEILEAKIYETARVEPPEQSVLMAVRDAACLMVNQDRQDALLTAGELALPACA